MQQEAREEEKHDRGSVLRSTMECTMKSGNSGRDFV
jgi:hypothetical protein